MGESSDIEAGWRPGGVGNNPILPDWGNLQVEVGDSLNNKIPERGGAG